MRFLDQIVIVTGGSSGIGQATARRFADEGAAVVAAGRDAVRLQAVASERHAGRIHPRQVDVGDATSVRRLITDTVTELGGLDILINCAGTSRLDPVLELDERHWHETLAVNLTGAFIASQEAARHMSGRHGGAIVNVASVDAFIADSPAAHYCVSKAGMLALTRSFAHELGHLGIRTNAVAPGFTATPMTIDAGYPRLLDVYAERIPLRRPATPEEQASVICFLASREAAYINGETVIVDGGMLAGMWYDPTGRPT